MSTQDGVSLARNRDFLFFIASRGGSMAGFQVLAVAAGWHVYARSQDVLNLGLIGLFMFLPFLLLFLVAGLVADMVDRRWILGIGNLVHAVNMLALGAWFLSGQSALWPVFALLVVSGSAQAFLHPAQQAILPGIVSRAEFPRAVAVSSSVTTVAQLGGPALAGLLLAVLDEHIYWVASGLYLVAGIGGALIRARLHIHGREPFGPELLFGGFRHIARTPEVLGAISIDLVAVLFGGVMGILPVYAQDILHVGPLGLGVMRATPALGALLVALWLTRFGMPFRAGPGFLWSIAVFGLSILVFALSHVFWLSVLALAVYGGSDMISMNIRQTLVQMRTPDALRGRVAAVNGVCINASNQLGDFRAGLMAAFTGTPATVAIGGAVTLGVVALWARLFPQLRQMERADI
ncbi:MFS transporter [Pseudooceanicola sp. CBS1P-1]|uniref:MFS transporter n=1 Tax=Pseudooceanicola albus TaxID=2692189 RepID=A0A6L7G102_9RHOB|nr:MULTISPECIES: MFS transporter [Pseudooceanicola]MBT9383435.1 MFS transporter [Pseudooceanicola endophyticus]MXN16243.1 MFS transporter [Pseudooceanicola albus]